MGARRKFTAEYKRETVAMLDVPRVTVSKIVSDLGIEANILGRWRRKLRQAPKPLATRLQRKYKQTPSAVLPEGHGSLGTFASRAQQNCAEVESAAQKGIGI